MRLRTARNAAAYFKERDPETSITEYYIRSLMRSGEIPVVKNGYRTMTSIEALEAYIQEQLTR